MARGHHWQAFYEVDQNDPVDDYVFTDVPAGAQIDNRRLMSAAGQQVAVRWRRGDAQRHFRRCDFVVVVGAESFVTNCVFSAVALKEVCGRASVSVIADSRGATFPKPRLEGAIS